MPASNKSILHLLLCLLISPLLSSGAFSLEVGELEVNSALGEPFSARFTLQHPTPLTEQELIIRQAPLEIYQQMGVDTATLYQDFRFTLLENGQVSIQSRNPIKEPFVNFIVQFTWPEGEMMKEFTVLLDPS